MHHGSRSVAVEMGHLTYRVQTLCRSPNIHPTSPPLINFVTSSGADYDEYMADYYEFESATSFCNCAEKLSPCLRHTTTVDDSYFQLPNRPPERSNFVVAEGQTEPRSPHFPHMRFV